MERQFIPVSALVVGYGSIGSRHARVLRELGCEVSIVSSCATGPFPAYHTVQEAISARAIEYVVISNPTVAHFDAIKQLVACGYKGRVLVEKPIFTQSDELPSHQFRCLYVGYNLRHHPLIIELKSLLSGRRALTSHIYVGQYLPDWRPQADYRSSYSARRNAGGGVLRDLSHELDLLAWMLGDWKALVARAQHVSDLEIDSEDVTALLIETQACPIVTLQMNYLDRTLRREIIVNCSDNSFKLDLIAGTLHGTGFFRQCELQPDHTYRVQHVAVLSDNTAHLCSAQEALQIIRMIESIERSSRNCTWEAA